MNEKENMNKELPTPYKERMNDSVVKLYDYAHIAFDIVREFGADALELENDDLVIVIKANEGER